MASSSTRCLATAAALVATGLGLTGTAGAQSTLQPEAERELARVFGTSIERANQLRQISSPAFVHSMAMFNALKVDRSPLSQYMLWHELALSVTAIDHAPQPAASPASYHEQFGPHRTSRALAMVHLAMFETVNLLSTDPAHQYHSLLYAAPRQAPGLPKGTVSLSAAITATAYETIHHLYPGLEEQPLDVGGQGQPTCQDGSKPFSLREFYRCSLAALSEDGSAIAAGVALGRIVAADLIRDRHNDGSELVEPNWGSGFIPLAPPVSGEYPTAQWQQDPVSQFIIALGGNWSAVRPFVLTSANQFRLSDEQAAPTRLGLKGKEPKQWPSYSAVLKYGGDTRLNNKGAGPTGGAEDLYYIAKYWAYDGTAGLCAPGRLYNQVADAVLAAVKINDVTDVARFYALVNLAMADAGIAAWESKYYFQLARPVTAVRAQLKRDAAPGSPASRESWYPLGAQNTNSQQTYNITPPFPSYPSGHAVFGGALFGILRQYFDPEAPFKFLSDEFNGKSKDVYNFVRCADGDAGNQKFCKQREFTLDCAEKENSESRIWMGVHWRFDADDGVAMGNRIAEWTFSNALQPKNGPAPTKPFAAQTTDRAKLTCKGINIPKDALVD